MRTASSWNDEWNDDRIARPGRLRNLTEELEDAGQSINPHRRMHKKQEKCLVV